MNFRSFAISLLLAGSVCAAFAAPPPAPAPAPAPPAPLPVTVQGILQVGEFLGAPGHGENPSSDEAEQIYYLQLPAPLSIQVQPAATLAEFSAAVRGGSYVQLVIFDEERSVAKSLVGKKIRIVGTLVETEAGRHRTPAVLQVKSLSAVRQWQW